jgi:two-component system chemotaxis sensor kinase CheA
MARAADDDLLPELLAIFAEEAGDRLQAMGRDILALEQAAEPDHHARLLVEIFRNAHTLKGAAAIVHLDDVTAIAHGLESAFDLLQRGSLRYGSDMFEALYGAFDALSDVVRAALSGAPSTVDVGAVTGSLEALTPAGSSGPVPATRRRVGRSVKSVKAVGTARALGAGAKGATNVANATNGANGSNGSSAPPDPTAGPVGESVRVASAKLDALMAQVGELLVARIGSERRVERLRQMAASLDADPSGAASAQDLGRQLVEVRRELEADGRRMAQLTATLQDDVRRARMLPVATLFDAFPRMVRDVATEQGKDVILRSEGGETEVDRSVLEHLRGPLTHLVRNAVDHGLELPDEREAAGKPRRGTIALRASQRGSTVVVEVQDDGRGVDPDAVRETAVARGIVTPAEAASMEDEEAIWLVFRPGFSTRSTVTTISGRGVGMDVVRESVERLQGIVSVTNDRGRGVRFSLTLPLTVATTRCLLVRCRDSTLGIPTVNVSHLLRTGPGSTGQVGGRMVLCLDDGPVPLVDLWDALGPAGTSNGSNGWNGATGSIASDRPVVVLRGGDRRVALAVDDLRGAEEVVIKPLPPPLLRIPGVAGVAILGSGDVVLIAAAAELLRSARGASVHPAASGRLPRPVQDEPPGATNGRPPGPVTILVVDDSFMTRTLAKNVLESAGYRVLVATDGVEAWTLLSSERFDLVLSDVQMPRMDGFDLTARIRAEERFHDLPVILLTSLDSKEETERGMAAGADAYLTKGSFEQARLLEAIRRLT